MLYREYELSTKSLTALPLSEPFRNAILTLKQYGDLETLIIGYMAKRGIEDPLQALLDLDKEVSKTSACARVTLQDFKGIHVPPGLRRKRARSAAESNRQAAATAIRQFGTLGHEVMRFGFNRHLPQLAGYSDPPANLQAALPFDDNQSLEARQLAFPFAKNQSDRPFEGEWIPETYLDRLYGMATCLTPYLNVSGPWHSQYDRIVEGAAELHRLMLPLFGPYADRIPGNGWRDPFMVYLWEKTWVTLIRNLAWLEGRETGCFFTEIQAVGSKRMSGGRIDAVEIRLEGQENRAYRSTYLRGYLARHEKRPFRSVSTLLNKLQPLSPFSVTIWDAKFAVGDHPTDRRVIAPEEVSARPLADHRRQMTRYICLTLADLEVSQGQQPWSDTDTSVSTTPGILLYGFPHKNPIRHELRLSPAEAHQSLEHGIGHDWPAANERARTRLLLRELARLTNGSSPTAASQRTTPRLITSSSLSGAFDRAAASTHP